MTLKSLADLSGPTIKKWAVHRPDGLLLKRSLGDTRDEALDKFLEMKHSHIPWGIRHSHSWRTRMWIYWEHYNFTINELMIPFEAYHALVNENAHWLNSAPYVTSEWRPADITCTRCKYHRGIVTSKMTR